jgi:hypothetical protein
MRIMAVPLPRKTRLLLLDKQRRSIEERRVRVIAMKILQIKTNTPLTAKAPDFSGMAIPGQSFLQNRVQLKVEDVKEI